MANTTEFQHMATAKQKLENIKSLISRSCHLMTDKQYLQAIKIWDQCLAKSISEDRLHRGDTEPTTKKDKAIRESDDKKRIADIGQNKEHKPVSQNKWKVRFPSGRTYLYTMNEAGALTKREVDDYIPTHRAVPELDHKHIAAMHEHIQTAEKEQTEMQKSQEPRRWGQTQRGLYDPINNVASPAAATAPAPAAALTSAINPPCAIRNSRDTTPLTGHQLAARKAGLPVDTPGLNTMTFTQMKQVAHEINVKATASLAAKAGVQYRR